MNFKKFKRKLKKVLLSLLLIRSLRVNSAQGAIFPGADGFVIFHRTYIYICRPREISPIPTKGLGIRLEEHPCNQNRPKKPEYDRYLPEFDCTISYSQAQSKFKHAKAFGVIGNPNRKTVQLFQDKMVEHMRDPETIKIKATYRKHEEVIHYFNPRTNLTVMKNATDNKFISGWKLNSKQVKYLKKKGDYN